MQLSVEFLGRIVDKNGVHVEDQKVEKVRDAIPPTTRKELRPFLVLASYYRKFIPGFAKTAKKLNEKTPDNVKFVWSEEMQTAFEELKEKLTSAPVLACPNYEEPFVVCTDASSRPVGAIISQADENGRDHPTHYASCALSAAESSYSPFEREAIGVIFALKKFRHYLTSKRFNIHTGHQALKFVFNMKDRHGRIARWFALLAEYYFEICYQARHDNVCANFLSQSIQLMAIEENQPFETNFKAIARYLNKLSIMDEPISITPELNKKAKDFLVHDERLFRTKYGIRFAPHIEMRERILKGLNDEVGHWDFNSTYSFARDRFWWPIMRQEVASFVKSCDPCQKTKPAIRKKSAGKITISRLFHTWCIDFAEPLPRTNVSNQYLIVSVEQMSKWPVSWEIPANLFNSLGVMEFVKKEVIMLFGPPQYILSDNDLNFDCKAVQDFARRFNIQWKCTSTYNPQGNNVVESMVDTLEKAIQEFNRSEPKEWDASLENVLYGYRRRLGPDGVATFEILFGVKPRFAIESFGAIPGEDVLANARTFGLPMALINRAERLVPRTLENEARYQIGDMVLLRNGKRPEGSKFEARMWLGPFKVISVEHPRYILENAPGRKSRNLYTLGVYVDTKREMSNISMVKRIARMFYSSCMKTA